MTLVWLEETLLGGDYCLPLATMGALAARFPPLAFLARPY